MTPQNELIKALKHLGITLRKHRSINSKSRIDDHVEEGAGHRYREV